MLRLLLVRFIRIPLARPEFPRLALALLLLSLSLSSTGCIHRHRQHPSTSRRAPSFPSSTPATSARHRRGRPAPPPVPIIQGEEGIASWYGHPYHGRRTANGEVYDMYEISAAHRTLPFGTKVRVHDLQNGRDLEVRINDRGPFIEGRIIDLSYAAAQAIQMSGIARVRLQILGYGETASTVPPPGVFAVQVGAFMNPENAQGLKARIESHYGPVLIQSFDRGDGLFHRVRVGNETSEGAALELARTLREENFATQTFVVRLN